MSRKQFARRARMSVTARQHPPRFFSAATIELAVFGAAHADF
jgi:hypothetical protein